MEIYGYVCTSTGFVSNGEHNTMRVKGYTRPLSVLQIKSQAKKKYSRMGLSTMLWMLTPRSMYYCYIYVLQRLPCDVYVHIFIEMESGCSQALKENPCSCGMYAANNRL